MDGRFPYEFIGFGTMDGRFPFEFIGFGAMDGHLAYSAGSVPCLTSRPRHCEPCARRFRAAAKPWHRRLHRHRPGALLGRPGLARPAETRTDEVKLEP